MALVVCAAIILLRVIPVYIHHYEVINSLKALGSPSQKDFSADPSENADLIRKRLMTQFDINNIDDIKPEEIYIVPDDSGNLNIHIKYQVKRPLVGNLSLLFDFDANQKVKVSAE
jgi:hypothetical protein